MTAVTAKLAVLPMDSRAQLIPCLTAQYYSFKLYKIPVVLLGIILPAHQVHSLPASLFKIVSSCLSTHFIAIEVFLRLMN